MTENELITFRLQQINWPNGSQADLRAIENIEHATLCKIKGK